MLLYKHRRYYAATSFFFVLLLAYILDIKPAMEEISLLQKTEKQLEHDVSDMQEFLKRRPALPEAVKDGQNKAWPQLLKDFFILAHVHHISILSINLKGDMFHMTAMGDFLDFAQFIFALPSLKWVVLVTDFSYQPKQAAKFIFNADILVCKVQYNPLPNRQPQKIRLPFYNPFCFAANTMPSNYSQEVLRQTPLDQIKLIGFLQQKNQKTAIISLPNGVITDVMVGSVIGNEHKVVKEITPSHIVT